MDVEETRNVDILEKLEDTAFSQQKVIRQAHERIVWTQALKSYKIGLLFKRAKQQLFTEKQPQDFLKWMVGKLIKKDYHAKQLKEFDPLEQVKLILTQAQDDLIACDLCNQGRFAEKNTQRIWTVQRRTARTPFMSRSTTGTRRWARCFIGRSCSAGIWRKPI